MMQRLIVPLLCLSFTVACQQKADVSTGEIDRLEAEMGKMDHLDTATARNLLDEYFHYAEAAPDDSLAPYMLYRAGDLLKEMDTASRQRSVEVFRRAENDYPDHPIAGKAAFMQAFVYDEYLKEKEKAIAQYERFIAEYPNHPLVADAKALKEFAQESEEEQMKTIEKWMNQDKEASKK